MLTEKQFQDINWQKNGNIMPVIIQHSISGEVLMMGYMNANALKATEQTGKVTFYSRSKQRLWTKGESSGNYLQVMSLYLDCDNDTLLILAYPLGPTCHNGMSSCFHPAISNFSFLYSLEKLLCQRKNLDPTNSYTARLYNSSTKRIAQKVGEEAIETAIAGIVQNQSELINEAADLVYHLLILLLDQQVDFSQVIAKLRERHLSDSP
ncbi:bifunctional phosphoribosyl-AMP cyclohydrolase/phosphoribosyl-ATP diphosphatase HisIE [Candidatus Palibaumannia cicadellinicola]|uniref:Histidine biosynthesis bifunctional protein HisIE n=1 Tax=Baumannia cicadellinicola subsp. Homalodisca coagulata TaxID=374463 RepID=Q1LT73_BAUCH|nr:bifunctional phosphoribosyl-AMP cyclohydrolase/phosphoribosyl-ATP diphosphatase HisIE [Candidatus Baumannia cicadellinicola]ABF14096.1 phosphoribosyl-AMP cyclohydrolase [Baumannia cicadellinicola str. Hc (Homalodisca coagulata)]MCJ7462119.1 bifunctional phosphoribosyl-AMP cyclohydrolase/phosphoribosyl-ATP diphosphatase HisIE [Candidatus Baumannia cicadellinicola]MCJ7462693.1 bifunctional phosphoribosyl-AMP cyclohydrolase/phosphoribosyl-ATP diphosphatase HisIE [Candidatus Baumannia cicadellini